MLRHFLIALSKPVYSEPFGDYPNVPEGLRGARSVSAGGRAGTEQASAPVTRSNHDIAHRGERV